MTGFIYKITNQLNGKAYIGKTTKSIEERFKVHIKDSKRENCKDRLLYRAFNKYGIENFSIEVVEEVSLEYLSNREIYWIGYYHSYGQGYNATIGGDSKILYDRDKILSMIERGMTTKQIVAEVGCCKDTVHDIAKAAGVKVFYEENDVTKTMKSSRKKVNQYDLKNNYLRSFDSYAEAARWLEKNEYLSGNLSGVRSKIGEVCKGKRKTAYKFIWRDAE